MVRDAIEKADLLIEAMGWIRQFRDKNTEKNVNAQYAEDLETGGLTTSVAAGLTYKVAAGTNAYVYFSKPVEIRSYVPKSATALPGWMGNALKCPAFVVTSLPITDVKRSLNRVRCAASV